MLVTKYVVLDMMPDGAEALGSYDTLIDAANSIVTLAQKNEYKGSLTVTTVSVQQHVTIYNTTGDRFEGKYTITFGNRRLNLVGAWVPFDPTRPPDVSTLHVGQYKAIDAAVAVLQTVTVRVVESLREGDRDNVTLYYKDAWQQSKPAN
jgi:hypothetical protein